MENNQNNYRISPAIAVAVILQLIFLIFAGITIHNLLDRKTEPPKIKIDNYSAIPNGKVINKHSEKSNSQNVDFNLDNYKSEIEESIYNVALINNKGNIEDKGAKIREKSAHYVYVEDSNTYFLNFIVDIEGLKQSYRFTWRRDNDSSGQSMVSNTMTAICLKEDEMIYEKFDCKDNYGGRGLDIVIYDLLSKRMFSNFTVGLSGVYDGKPLTFSINVSSDSESAKSAAVKEVSDYLAELGFNLDDFKYSVKYIGVANQTLLRYPPSFSITIAS